MNDNEITRTIIIPAAGASSRFSETNRPKWLLTNPNGKLMIEDCITGIDDSNTQLILIGLLESHIDKYCNSSIDFFDNKYDVYQFPI